MKQLILTSLLIITLTDCYSQRLLLYNDNNKKITSFKKGKVIRIVLKDDKPLDLNYANIDSIRKIDYHTKKKFTKSGIRTITEPVLYFTGKITKIYGDSLKFSNISVYSKTNDIRINMNYINHFTDIYFKYPSNSPAINYKDIHLIYKNQDWKLTTTAMIMVSAFVAGVLSPVIAYDFKNNHFHTNKFLTVAGISFSIYLGGGYVMTGLQNNTGYYTTDKEDLKKLSKKYKFTKMKIE